MIVYFRSMRHKDDIKRDAIHNATIKLVNEIGFVASSVSKIAKEAGVSPATIYIYFENKEDLLSSVYLDVKKKLSQAMLNDFDADRPVRDTLNLLWLNVFNHITNNQESFRYTEQFSYSPYHNRVDHAEIDQYFQPVFKVLERGIQQKIIKDTSLEVLAVFIFYPVLMLSNSNVCLNFKATEENIEKTFQMAWDAIKL